MTDYFQKTQEIFNFIKNREKLKLRLQSKANKSIYLLIKLDELTLEDKEKLRALTREVDRKIKNCKQQHGENIVWKGLYYEWVKFY